MFFQLSNVLSWKKACSSFKIDFMTLHEVREKYLTFFKDRGHVIIPSSLLVPENDPTTLFTGSGMQPLLPYFLGQPHPAGKRVTDSQKSFRADDIDEVGDNRHTTFFEMLGNWSFGDYFKAEQLPWFFEFLTDKEKGCGLDPNKLFVTVFAGDSDMNIPADEESAQIWKELFAKHDIDAKYIQLGSEANGSEVGMQGGRIFSYDVKKNWWSRAGVPSKMPVGEPGGPDSEVFYDFGTPHDTKFGKECHPNCDCGRFLEIGNSVFMEYKKSADGTFEKLTQRNVDFGGGLERITAATINNRDVFQIDVFQNMLGALDLDPGFLETPEGVKKVRIILDHMRAAVFLIGDGVLPSNKGQGYVLRRLLRRAALFSQELSSGTTWIDAMVGAVISSYKDVYKNLEDDSVKILAAIKEEFAKFNTALKEGLREFEKIIAGGTITGKDAFDLYQSYGFPWEVTEEIAQARGITVDRAAFEQEFTKHRDLSRTASAGTFKGGLADTSEKTTKLHTTHHLLLKALQIVLGPEVKQRGSNITSERLRLDFSYADKMTDEQKKEVERIVNEKIAEDLPVIRSEMALEDAEKLHAEHEFGQKYPERVSVYSIGPKSATQEDPQFSEAFSIEFCGGPHVQHTGVIGHFTFAKEEASSAGVRRARGVVKE
jgi:alanyl-tRNA synthetase